ncbi:MAG: ComEC family competence protein [Elusimicrobia bacterium]|nr:ComEC family competence protein [Elusimicrobiota bacterium]
MSYLRRPLFLALIFYAALLSWLKTRGFFETSPAAELSSLRRTPGVALSGTVISAVREDHRGVKVLIKGRAASPALGTEVPFPQRVLAYLPENSAWRNLRPGQPVFIRGRLRWPRSPRNPGEFDEKSFLSDRGVAWIMEARDFWVEPRPVAWYWRPFRAAEAARRSMQDRFEACFPEERARVLAGICLGYKGPLPRELNRAFQDAGVMHLLVPSGAKVALVLAGVAALLAPFSLALAVRFLLCALAGGFYLLMVGLEPPYVRAYLGFLFLWAGMIWDRESGAFQATVLSAWAILLADPRALFSAGFQMTYAAMAGIFLAPPSRRGVFSITIIVQLMLWPIFCNTFGRGSLVGALANLALIPSSAILMAAGFSLWGFSFLFAGPGIQGLIWATDGMLRAFIAACFWFSSWPWAAVDLSPMSRPAILAYYLVVCGFLVLPRRKVALALVCAGLAAAAATQAWRRLKAPALRAVYLSLPRAQAALLTWEGRRHWLVLSQAPAGPVLAACRAYGIRRVERLVVLRKEARLPKGFFRLFRDLQIERVDESRPDAFEACEKRICLGFDPPRVRRGFAEYSIIPPYLKRHALEVATDGRTAQIAGAFP